MRAEKHLARLHAEADAAIVRREESRYSAKREVDLRDAAVQAMRDLVTYLDARSYGQLVAHVQNVCRPIAEEIDGLHELLILEAHRGAA
jgi:hypothetical protein